MTENDSQNHDVEPSVSEDADFQTIGWKPGHNYRATSKKADLSMMLGFVSLFATPIIGIPAIVLGFMGLGEIRTSAGKLGGKGRAFTGIFLGILSIGITVLAGWLLMHQLQSGEEARRSEAENFAKRAAEFAKKGDLPRAIAAYSRAIVLMPHDALLYEKRGIERAKQGDLDDAFADFTKAIELTPNASAYNKRAIIRAEKKDLDGAIADASKAIDLEPDYAEAYVTRGLSLLMQDKEPEAVADFEQYLKLHPELKPALDKVIREAKSKRAPAQ